MTWDFISNGTGVRTVGVVGWEGTYEVRESPERSGIAAFVIAHEAEGY